jgi:hypothetical protein
MEDHIHHRWVRKRDMRVQTQQRDETQAFSTPAGDILTQGGQRMGEGIQAFRNRETREIIPWRELIENEIYQVEGRSSREEPAGRIIQQGTVDVDRNLDKQLNGMARKEGAGETSKILYEDNSIQPTVIEYGRIDKLGLPEESGLHLSELPAKS